jgi:hypothetical protein
MTDELKDKLREILLSRSLGQYMSDSDGNIVPVNWEDSPLIDQYIDEIDQAYKKAGYVKMDMSYELHTVSDNRMTGQEWYEKFASEIKKDDLVHVFTPNEVDIAKSLGIKTVAIKMVLVAAKKAAGIE